MTARPCTSIVVAALALCGLGAADAHAQAPAPQPAPPPPEQAADEGSEHVDAWVDRVLEQQRDGDVFLRVLGAPSATLLGGLWMLEPLWGEQGLAADVAFVAGGAGLLTAAVGAWATSDPYDAQLWYGRAASLGFAAIGVGLVAMCTDSDSHCSQRPFPRHMGTSLGIIGAGLFVSSFVLWTFAPPPSPQELRLALRGISGEQRHARVLDFLRERERLRRIGAYVALPWGLAMAASFFVFANDAETSEGRAVVYGLGGISVALVAATTLYELLHTPESARFAAGERPED